MCSTMVIGHKQSACLAPVNCSCLTAFVGQEANLLMYLQEPSRGDGASGSVRFLLSFSYPQEDKHGIAFIHRGTQTSSSPR